MAKFTSNTAGQEKDQGWMVFRTMVRARRRWWNIAPVAAMSMIALAGMHSTAQAQTVASDDSGTLEEIVITARHRSEDIEKAPLSIAALSSDRIQELGVKSVLDLDSTVPSLQFGSDANRLQPFTGVRGVGDYSRDPGFDNRAGIYVDGVLLGRSDATNSPIFDIQQVEVARGPQGTLFGKDALTGVVSITTVKPGPTEDWKGDVQVGSRNLFDATGFFNAPINDTLFLRISMSSESQDGYYTNLYNGVKLGSVANTAGRVQLRWQPSADTTVDFSVDHMHSQQNLLIGGRPLAGPAASLDLQDYQVDNNPSPEKNRTLDGASITLSQKLPADYELTSITAYRTVKSDLLNNDLSLSAVDLASDDLHDRDKDFSQEIRVASPADRELTYVLGVFYYRQDPSLDANINVGQAFPIAPVRGGELNLATNVLEHVSSVFGHGTYRPIDWLAFDAGVRYNHTTKEIAYQQQPGALTALGYANVPSYADSLSENTVSPTASVTVTPVEDVNLYALYSTGARAGGYNADLLTAVNFTNGGIKFGSESVKNYELGIKSFVFDRRLRLNLAAYIEKFENFQVSQLGQTTVVVGGVPSTISYSAINNAARATSKGVEADFDAAIFQGFRLSGGVALNKATYDSFPNAYIVSAGPPTVFGNWSGHTLIEAPRFNGSVTGDYTWAAVKDWHGDAALSYTYKSLTYSDPSNSALYRQPAHGLASVRVAALNHNGTFEIALFARNLFDRKFVESAGVSGLGYPYLALNEPRTIGLELTVHH